MSTHVDQSMEWVAEYDHAALWCAKRGHTGKAGDPLPTNLSSRVLAEINTDQDAFEERVRAMAYWAARERAEVST